MTRPRSIAISVIAAALAWSATASAYSSINSARSRWPGAPAVVNYQINANFASTAAGTPAQQDATIRAAAASWNATASVDLRASTGTTATVANDGVNAIFASPTASGNALAATFVWSSGGDIIEFDMVFFEGTFRFAIPANLNSTNFDIQSIALHELGHAVGIGHSHGRSLDTTRWATWTTYPAMKDHVGDFDGDGRDDVLKFDVSGPNPSVNGVSVGLSTGIAFTNRRWADWTTYPYMQEHIGDFNGDGKDDILKFDVPASGQASMDVRVALSDGTQFLGPIDGTRWDTWTTYRDMRTHVGDFDGDGKDDIMKFDILGNASLGLWVGLSDGTKFNGANTRWATWITYPEMKTLVGDFNGDGKDDIMKFDVPPSGQAIKDLKVGLSDGTRFLGGPDGAPWGTMTTSKDVKVLVGEFNGDGKDDVMMFDVSGHSLRGLWVGLSDGTRFITAQWDSWTTYPEMKVHAGDFNGDTLSDVMKFDVPSSGIAKLGLWFGQSTGNRFFSMGDGDTVGLGDTATGNDTDMWACDQNHPEMKTHVGDFDGDHVDDILKIDVLPSGPALTGLYVGRSRDDANPVMFPAIGRGQANRTLEFDERNAIGCYYR